MILVRLFLSFALVGLLTIGGGYSSLALIKEQAVEINGWLTMTEFSDLITISEITPGPIAINSATFVGTRVAGLPGAFASTLGFVTPPFIVVSLLYLIYRRYRSLAVMQGILMGLRPTIVALIASAGMSILILALWGEGGISLASTDIFACALFAAALAVLKKWKPNPILVILGCGAAGLAAELLRNLTQGL
jgi:chromate transporter